MKRHSLLLGTLALTTFILGCESKESQDIFAAQTCIDKLDTSDLEVAANRATLRSEVEVCVKDIQSYSSQEAFVLKCASGFIAGGIAEDAIIETLSQLDREEEDVNGAADDPTAGALEALSFGDTMADQTLAMDTLEDCKSSDSKNLIALAGLANVATILGGAASDDGIAGLIDGFDPDSDELSDEEKVDLANSILDSRVELCSPSSGLLKDEEFCGDLNTAVEDNKGGENLTEEEKQTLINDFLTGLDDNNQLP